MSGFIIGVASSLFAVFLIYLVRNQLGIILNLVFKRYFPNVSGKYLCTLMSDNVDAFDTYPNQKEYMFIKQISNKIYGHIDTYSGEELKEKCLIHGVISVTRILRISYESKTTDHHELGVGIFKLDTEGKNFEGYVVGLCSICQKLTTAHAKLVKLT